MKKFLPVLALVACAFGFLFLAYWLTIQLGGEEARRWMAEAWAGFREFLLTNGFWLFVAIAVLPAFICPVAPLLTLAGLWGGQQGVWLACGYSALAVIMNLSWTYWLAAGPGRKLIEWLLTRTKYEVPQPDKDNEMAWALILRFTPGVPFIFTNYALGLIRMPFWRYFLVSSPVLVVTAGGYVLAFAGIFSGDWAYAWMGISVIVALAVAARMVTSKGTKADSVQEEGEVETDA